MLLAVRSLNTVSNGVGVVLSETESLYIIIESTAGKGANE